MTETPKELMIRYLQTERDVALWKLEGASEYDVRRPLVPSGSNLLGIVKHLAWCEFGYFTQTFGRELPVPDLWSQEGVDPHDDLWVPAEESRQDVIDFYLLAQGEAARTFQELELDSEGRVPWWPDERATVTLHQILVHMSVETARHVGQMDILREGVDGATGMRPEAMNLPDDDYDWAGYVAKVEAAARTFRNTDYVQLIRAELIVEHDPVEESIVIVREEQRGDEAAVAFEFEGSDGHRRRGMEGATRREDGIWRASGGFLGGMRDPAPDAAYANYGGWGNTRRQMHGGWVADLVAVTARLVDISTGQVLAEDHVTNGVVMFLLDGDAPLRHARVELRDADGRLLRAQLLNSDEADAP